MTETFTEEMDEPMEEDQMPMQKDTEGETSLEGQTIYIPKGEEGYSVPESGRAMISFEKIDEDDGGCFVRVHDFETEAESDPNEITDDMESSTDHVNSFIKRREESGEGY